MALYLLAKAKPVAEEQPAVEIAAEDQPVVLTEPSVPQDEPPATEEPVTEQVSEPEIVAGSKPSVETLAAAVEEIKKYINKLLPFFKSNLKSQFKKFLSNFLFKQRHLSDCRITRSFNPV